MEIPMPAPVCLIENSPAGELRVQQEALRVLAEMHQPVVVVAVAGLYRTGKSYLMNKLAGKRTGFSLGSTVQSHTKGIWMWCVPHPCRAGHTLVLLDTEGLGDVEKGDTKNDTWIFALAVLLSSTLVYNSMGTINQQAMDQLHYVTELTERIKVKATGGGSQQDGEESADFVRFFPAFVWAVRDFTLQLELDGRKISEDEYLENALKLKTGSSERAQLYNLPRECIRQFFPARKCFVFIQPAGRRDLARLEELSEAELEPEFQEQAAQFCRHVWNTSQPKTVPGGHVVTGAMLGNLAVTYVDAIRSGAVPCMESAVLALAQIENSAAVGEAVAVYEQQLARGAALPMETMLELLELHAQCEREALRAFMARAFKDDDRRFQGELMAEAVLQEFLQSKEAVAQSILQTDETLTEKEKEMAALKVQAEAAEREQQILRQKEAELQQKLEDQERSYQENLRQLEEKLEGDRKKLLEEQGKMVDQKLKEQEALLREGFQKEAGRMADEIRRLQQQSEEIQKPSWISSALETVSEVATFVLPGFIGKAVGAAGRFFSRLF
ncbi:guanylate-binding protein 1-like isoform X2 [Emydura macquarii macquarii]|uniref:guanylate-binding protein 1-like isoform X2 n=1 Tax=Emydura macquarii macquarii TaxID=1129001 RepID=UPI00352B6E30